LISGDSATQFKRLEFETRLLHNVFMRDLESLSREELIGVILDQHRLIER
jgi:hypothetical protein